jgi:hypothetical protein
MKKATLLLLVLPVVFLPALMAHGIDFEAKMGLAPSIAIATELDVFPPVTMSAFFGIQTDWVNPQTSSYTVGVTAKFWLASKRAQFAPYIGLSGGLKMDQSGSTLLGAALAGVRFNLGSNFYVLTEATVFIPVLALDVAGAYWELGVGFGARL